MDRSTLESKSVDDLKEIARQVELSGYSGLRKAQLIDAIVGELEGSDDADDGNDQSGADQNGADQNGADQGEDDGAEDEGAGHRDEVIRRRRSRNRSRDDDAGGNSNGRTRARSRERRKRNSGGSDKRSEHDGLEVREGVLDLLPEGYGFLRTTGYVSGDRDVYVSQSYVRRFNLRRGDLLGGPVKWNKGNDKFPAMARLETCEGGIVDNEHDPLLRDRPEFGELDVEHPDEQLELGGEDQSLVLAAVDAFAPVGRGQRALLRTPPTADTGALVRALVSSIADGYDDVEIFVALIDARPEEVAECERRLDAEVVGSPLDAPPEDHVAAAELVVERAKRLAERGEDVVVVLDSLTNLGRAYNLAGSSSGRTLPGGIDTGAIGPLKQLFGAARNLVGAGSLTMLAVAGDDPQSATDSTILDHLRGAGTAELRFVPELGGDGEVPALDVHGSATRRAAALLGDDVVEVVAAARGALADLDRGAAWQVLADTIEDGPAAVRDAAREAAG